MPVHPNRNTPTGQIGLGGSNSSARSPPVPCQTELLGKAICCSLNITRAPSLGSSAAVASGRMDTQTWQLLGWNDPQREPVPPNTEPRFLLAGQGPWLRCWCASSRPPRKEILQRGWMLGVASAEQGLGSLLCPLPSYTSCVHPLPPPHHGCQWPPDHASHRARVPLAPSHFWNPSPFRSGP